MVQGTKGLKAETGGVYQKQKRSRCRLIVGTAFSVIGLIMIIIAVFSGRNF